MHLADKLATDTVLQKRHSAGICHSPALCILLEKYRYPLGHEGHISLHRVPKFEDGNRHPTLGLHLGWIYSGRLAVWGLFYRRRWILQGKMPVFAVMTGDTFLKGTAQAQ